MGFPAKKNAGCPKAPRDFPPRKDGILYPRRVVLGLPSPSHRVCADGRTYGRTDGRSRDYYVRTKISWIDSLPNFLSNGAPLAGFARRLRYYSTIASVYHVRRKPIHESMRVYCSVESVLHCSVLVSNHLLNKSFKMIGKYCSGIINIIQ